MDVKETKELLTALNEISLILISEFKDGVSVEDIAPIFAKIKANPDLSDKLIELYNKANLIPEELKDLTLAEGVELGLIQLQYVPKFIEALKTP